MKVELKHELNHEDCTRIIQGINTLENIWDDAKILNEYDKFTIEWLRKTFNICRESIDKHKKVEIRVIGR